MLDAFGLFKRLDLCAVNNDIIIDIDSAVMNWRHNESLCLTASRGRTGGYFVSSRGRRMTAEECLRLQAYNPKLVNLACISQVQVKMAAGNAMTVSVIERMFLRLLPAAKLARVGNLKRRWEDVACAIAQLRAFI